MPVPSVFVGGVDISHACLRALCDLGLPPALAIGYDASRASVSGFRDLGDLADAHGFELLRVAQVNDPAVVARVRDARPAVMFVIGWSQLLRAELLGVPEHGSVGIHPTPLPLGRGRAPIPWTILKGLDRTASTMFFLTEGVDDGDVVGAVDVEVDAREDAGTLYAKHRVAHVELIRRYAADLIAGTAPRTPQDHDAATWWEARRPEDGRIDPAATVAEADRLVRAVTRPFPGAFVEREGGGRLTIWRAEPAPGASAPAPGAIVTDGESTLLGCADGALRVLDAEG